MAIVQNPIIGRASGKFGTAVFSTLFGQNILRSAPVEVRVSIEPQSIQARLSFAVAIAFIKRMYSFISNVFPISACQMTPSSFVMKSVRAAVEGTGELTKVDAKRALELFAPKAFVDLTVTKSVADEVTIVGDLDDTWPDLIEGDIIYFVVINNDKELAATLEFTCPADFAIDHTFPLVGHEVTDEIVVYGAPKKVVKFKAGAELANVVG
jgi:hypothetical protein